MILKPNKKNGIQPLTINRKADSGKKEQYLILKAFCFQQQGTRYQLTEWQNWETEWYIILMSLCFQN